MLLEVLAPVSQVETEPAELSAQWMKPRWEMLAWLERTHAPVVEHRMKRSATRLPARSATLARLEMDPAEWPQAEALPICLTIQSTMSLG